MSINSARGQPVSPVPIIQMSAHDMTANLRERSHLGDIINVQFDIHLGCLSTLGSQKADGFKVKRAKNERDQMLCWYEKKAEALRVGGKG